MTTPGKPAASVIATKGTKKSDFRRSEEPTRPLLPKAHRRVAFIAGPLSLVITNIGLLTLVLPLAIWYAIVVLKNLFVGLVGLTGGEPPRPPARLSQRTPRDYTHQDRHAAGSPAGAPLAPSPAAQRLGERAEFVVKDVGEAFLS